MGCGEGNGTPLQYSCLENPMDGGAWWATVHGVAKSWTRMSNFTFTFFQNTHNWCTPKKLTGKTCKEIIMAENFPSLIKDTNSETKKLNKSQEAEV